MGHRRGMQLKAVLSLGILVGFGTVSTLAAWTTHSTVTATLGAATVTLGVGETAESATQTHYTLPLQGAELYPGDSRAAMVTLKNTGSIDLPYTLGGTYLETADGTLGNALNIAVHRGGTVQGSEPHTTCSGGTPVLSKESGQVFRPAEVQSAPLAVGASQHFCVHFSLPETAANELQGAQTAISLNFTATVGS